MVSVDEIKEGLEPLKDLDDLCAEWPTNTSIGSLRSRSIRA